MQALNLSTITLAVLAGGASVRMGRPKAAITISGKPALEYLLERHSWPGPTLLVTAPGREHPAGWEKFHAEVGDPIAGEGPLRGVLTALQHAATPMVLVLTVDMPCLSPEHVQWLISKAIELPWFYGIMLSRTLNGGTQIEPFPFLCCTEAAQLIARRLSEGRRSVHSLTSEPGFCVQPAPAEWPQSVWTNLNTPEDLAKLEKG